MKNCKLLTVFFTAFMFLVSNAGFAQDDSRPATLQYIADYKIAWNDLAEWTEMHHEHAAPLLDSLVESGVITAWSAWEHHTGSDYNWRLIIDANEWDDFDDFWNGYLGGFSGDLLEISGGMIHAHRDQIWDQLEVQISGSAESIPLAYEALFQIDFNKMETWNKHWNETYVPLLEKAMEEGFLAGWVVDSHNSGDRFNRAQVYLFEEWDDIDDMFGILLPGLMADEAAWNQVGGMIRGHTDTIWNRVSDQENQ